MDILFSFDTEDYIDPVSNDALLRLARAHTRHGVPATFGLVGEKARFLWTLGRDDVIAELKHHEVGYHSDHHFMRADPSYDPMHVPAYTETQGWDAGVARLLAEESRGLHDIAEVFGRRPTTFLRTFGDWGPQMMAAYAQLDVPVFAYGPMFYTQDTAPMWYCNQLHVANPRVMYEKNLHVWTLSAEEKLAQLKAELVRHLEQGTPRLGWVTHPTRFISDVWWEAPNWFDRREPWPRARWEVPARFERERIDELLWIADGLVGFASELSDVVPRTFREFYDEYRPGRIWVSAGEVTALAGQVEERPAVLWAGGEPFSPAEAFGVFAHQLSAGLLGVGPERSPLRRLLGPTEEPVADGPGGDVSRQDLARACVEVELWIREHARVPHAVDVGGDRVGPGTFFNAMAAALRGPECARVAMRAAENLPVPCHEDDYERIAQGRPLGVVQYWSDREAFDFPRVRRHAQLQMWTFKPAVRSRS